MLYLQLEKLSADKELISSSDVEHPCSLNAPDSLVSTC